MRSDYSFLLSLYRYNSFFKSFKKFLMLVNFKVTKLFIPVKITETILKIMGKVLISFKVTKMVLIFSTAT